MSDPRPPRAAAVPAGSRDVLAVEAQELRAVEAALRERFERRGYREVMTPVLEFAEVIDRAQEGGSGAAFRLFDEAGRVLVLRPDPTIPVARLVATRMAEHPGPVRVCYVARAFRPPLPGRPRPSEQRQAGVELVGPTGPGADAEAIALLAESLAAAGLEGFTVGIADVSLTAAVLDCLRLGERERAGLRAALAGRDLVEWGRLAAAAVPAGPGRDLLVDLPRLHGGVEVLERLERALPAAAGACARLRVTLALAADQGAGEAAAIDLAVVRDLPYYSGVVFEAYAPGAAEPVAMGGRYDALAGRFGVARPAVGFAIGLEPLHRALVSQQDGPEAPRPGVVLVGALDQEAGAAAAARRAGLTVIALGPEDEERAEALAAADGWRFVARREGEGYAVLDRASGSRGCWATLEEGLSWR